jgi:uncharacterized repeat protein (TIGR03803 family)
MQRAVRKFACLLAAAALALVAKPAAAATEIVLHSFCAKHHCQDGAFPTGRLRIAHDGGAIYGVAYEGGAQFKGLVFELNTKGNYKSLYDLCSQPDCADGGYPAAGLVRKDRVIYGTASALGPATSNCFIGCGTIFMLDPDGAETTLYSFLGGSDGDAPNTPLAMDAAGNLYGTTASGGQAPDECHEGCGTIFRLAPDSTETVLYRFCSQRRQSRCADGGIPSTRVLFDAAGNIYGATAWGGRGCPEVGCGIVFKLAPDGTESVLYSFTGNRDGAFPNGLIRDREGNFYGTTGGGAGVCFQYGCGTIFKIAPDGQETTLHRFSAELNCTDGAQPNGLVMDRAGNFYGTTAVGGNAGTCNGDGCGTAFKLSPDGTFTTLYTFCSQAGCMDGASPGELAIDDAGKLYGVTATGGAANQGTLFEIQQ